MFRFVILFALLVCALTHPMLRQTRETDDEPSPDNTLENSNGTDLEGRFGGHGRRPYGGGYGQPGYGNHHGGYPQQGGMFIEFYILNLNF